MDQVLLARDILDILFLDTVADDLLWESAQEAYRNGRFEEGARLMLRRYQAIKAGQIDDLSVADTQRGEAAYFAYLGAHYLAKGDLITSQAAFSKSVESLHGYRYDPVGLAGYTGLGLALRCNLPGGNRHIALDHLNNAWGIARQLCQRSKLETNKARRQRCERISNWLAAIVKEVQDISLPRLIPVLHATAGEPRYVPGDDVPYETDRLAIADHTYRLLDYRNRNEAMYRIKRLAEYFCVKVHGNSMMGEPKASIRDADMLLANATDAWDAHNGSPMVVQEEDALTMVKFVEIKGRQLQLISANPNYPPRIYTARSQAIRPLGTVEAILEEL